MEQNQVSRTALTSAYSRGYHAMHATPKVFDGAYWAKALALIPDLRFELISTMVGVDSITLYYRGARGRLAAEVFHFGPDKKVVRAFAHYTP